MRYLSLFSGGGGGDLAMQHLLGWRCLGHVENDAYCQDRLRQRAEEGLLASAPIFGDIREFLRLGYAREYQGMVDAVAGGFPCQPFSVAGRQRGEADERNLWPETAEVLRQVRPRFAFLENVPGLLSSGYWGAILSGLAALGYDIRWGVLGARHVGAPHRRDRLWIRCELADSDVVSDPGRVGQVAGEQVGFSRRRGAPDALQDGTT